MLRVGGKFFPTPAALAPPDASATVPAFQGRAITGAPFSLQQHVAGHVSLLTICFSAYAEVASLPAPPPHPLQSQLESFRGPFRRAYVVPQQCRIAEIRPIMTTLKWLVYARMMRSAARQAVPEAEQASYVIAHKPTALVDALHVPNRLGAYVYLIDRQGRVRWRACGEAAAAEVDAMLRATDELLGERKSK